MRVRRVTRDEWRALRDLRLRALEEDPTAFDSSLERERAFPERTWRERAAAGAAGVDVVQVVAEDEHGRLVGLAGGLAADGGVDVFGMWVAPSARGHGLGGRLLDAVLAWARDTHPDRPVGLWVNHERADAKRLYASRGFRPTGETGTFDHVEGERGERMRLTDRAAETR